jgi:hypothetical protein
MTFYDPALTWLVPLVLVPLVLGLLVAAVVVRPW